ANRKAVVHQIHKGEFLKPCPGTTAGYLCCGYQILTPLMGCGMYCRYCVLQAYFEDHRQIVFDNFYDLEKEVHQKLAGKKGVVRLGTGEFADSLYLEPSLGMSQKIAALLAPYPNVIVEFKTKSTNVEFLKSIKDPSKVIVGFSMNTPAMISALERDTATLAQRLDAIRKCIAMGFWVAVHFDPMVYYPKWEAEYRDVVKQIFQAIPDGRKIAWWSMGGFRTMPALKQLLVDHNLHLPLFAGEMMLGVDRKYRYLRPLRVAFYSALREEVENHFKETPLYLCMESPEVWHECGMIGRIPHGLAAYLDVRAKQMLFL
ncbi:MAG: radical SAM protein, partial [Chitinivibrionales bacterium]|nr:radical SAM protein [Chitinivibrionales bacterium]